MNQYHKLFVAACMALGCVKPVLAADLPSGQVAIGTVVMGPSANHNCGSGIKNSSINWPARIIRDSIGNYYVVIVGWSQYRIFSKTGFPSSETTYQNGTLVWTFPVGTTDIGVNAYGTQWSQGDGTWAGPGWSYDTVNNLLTFSSQVQYRDPSGGKCNVSVSLSASIFAPGL